jgi:Ca-activated chloride channel family protein
MRPQGNPDGQAQHQKGLDLIFVLDLSQSMAAPDILPRRIDKAKELIRKSLPLFKNDQVGLVVVAGSAYLAVPLTKDYQTIDSVLSNLEPKPIGKQGTNLDKGINVAVNAFQNGANATLSKEFPACFAIVLSDGEETIGKAVTAAVSARERGVIVYTLGIGTEAGARVPYKDAVTGLEAFKKDSQGQEVISKLNANSLSEIASKGEGIFFNVEQLDSAVPLILEDARKYLNKRGRIVENKRYTEYYELPIQAAIFCLLMYMYLPLRRRKISAEIKTIAFIIIFCCPLLASAETSLPWQSLFWTADKRATEKARLFLDIGDTESAVAIIDKQLAKEGNEILAYNAATSLSQTNRFDETRDRLKNISASTMLAPYISFTQAGVAKKLSDISTSKEFLFSTIISLEALESARTIDQERLLIQAKKNMEFAFKDVPEPPPPEPPPPEPPPPPLIPPPVAEEGVLDKALTKTESDELLDKTDSVTADSLGALLQTQSEGQGTQEATINDW